MRCLDIITNSMDMNLSKLRVIVQDRGAWRATIHRVAESDTLLNRNNNYIHFIGKGPGLREEANLVKTMVEEG